MPKRRWTAVAIVVVTALATATAGLAKDGDVRVKGVCTGSSAVKLKLSREDGRIEAELEIDQNRNGVRWTWTLSRPGTVVARGSAVTRGPSGSFEVRRLLADTAGRDTITGRAARGARESCRVTATI
jgi:hypothetical protein